MATPSSVSIMLITILATDSLSEVDGRIMDFLSLRAHQWRLWSGAARTDRCHFTGETTLFHAVRKTLSDPECAIPLTLEVIRKTQTARLVDEGHEDIDSEFRGIADAPRPQIEHVTRFGGLFNLAVELDVAANPNSTWVSALRNL